MRHNGGTIVYKATNKLSGGFYIGMTKATLGYRQKQHEIAARNKAETKFTKAIRDYGIENFEFYELYRFESRRDAEDMERMMISDLNPHYNVAPGGDGYAHWLGKSRDEATKRKISETKLARGSPRPSDEIISNLKILGAASAKSRRKPIRVINDGRVFESLCAAALALGLSKGNIAKAIARNGTAGKLRFEYDD
jgi:group I intron endonuclease